MHNKNLYIDFHVIQTVPPSCINRDDTGSPKTAIYGGTMRARVSSQAWKRAVRDEFRKMLPEENIGIRTRNTKLLISEAIRKMDSTIEIDEAEENAETMLKLGKAKGDGKDVLFFISRAQIQAVAMLALEYMRDKSVYDSDKKKNAAKKDKIYEKKIVEALNENPGIDMALFGRMSASNQVLSYDASCQVAHAISTHSVNIEYDYFSAVDDTLASDTSGKGAVAGHLGTVEFNSSTMYRYATVSILGLSEYLDTADIPDTVKVFASAFFKSMPTGKQNTFANKTLPDMIYVALRTDQPINLSGAFEKPVPSGEEGFVSESIQCFGKYAQHIYDCFVDEPVQSWVVGTDNMEIGKKVKLSGLLEEIRSAVENQLEE